MRRKQKRVTLAKDKNGSLKWYRLLVVSGWASSQYPLVFFKWYIGSCPNSGTVDHKRFISGPYKKSDDDFPTVTAFRLGIAPQRKKWLTLCATLRPARNASKTGNQKTQQLHWFLLIFEKIRPSPCWFMKNLPPQFEERFSRICLPMLGTSDPKWRFHGDFPWYNPLENTPSTHPGESTCPNFNDVSWVQEFKDLDPKSIDFLWVFLNEKHQSYHAQVRF